MNIRAKKILGWSALAVSLLAIEAANAAPVSVSVVGKDSITFVVSGLSNAAGFGGHFSTGIEDGFGGTNTECHFVSGSVAVPASTLTLVCYDGYQSPTQHVNQFRLELGPKKETQLSGLISVISHATFTISKRGVQVDVTRVATSGYTNERTPYTISSFFPLRESSGFFKTGTIYYENDGNGVLAGTPGRDGTGYVLDSINPVITH